ncbi:MAG: ABC transporter ATP-binding protein [Planctomycetaceae bacterium]
MPQTLQISDLQFRYDVGQSDVLLVPSVDVNSGEFISLLGASGSGKSTLLRLIAGLLQPSGGQIRRPTSAGAQHTTGMVFQHPNLIPWRTARQNVRLPAELGSRPSKVNDDVLDELFRLVGLKAIDTDKRSSELSGGMQMRVSLARALVLQPTTLLMDEPFAALDDLLRMQLEEDVRTIHIQRSLTTILVTHNISEAVFMSDRVLVLGGHPSTIHADIEIRLPQDRDRRVRSQADFHDLVERVTEAMHSAAGTDRTS